MVDKLIVAYQKMLDDGQILITMPTLDDALNQMPVQKKYHAESDEFYRDDRLSDMEIELLIGR